MTDAVLPDDQELALDMLGSLADRARRSEAKYRADLELRDAAVEALCGRDDINKTRASIRMAIERQRFYQIRDARVAKRRTG